MQTGGSRDAVDLQLTAAEPSRRRLRWRRAANLGAAMKAIKVRVIVASPKSNEVLANVLVECTADSLKHAAMRISDHITDRFPEKPLAQIKIPKLGDAK
jgi:hypothetical protein